jgi:hypothetical protein
MTAQQIQQITEGYRAGMHDAEIMEILGVSRGRFERAYANDRDFQEFIDMGRTLAEAWWMRKGREGLSETKFNTNLWMFIAKNRFDWAEKLDTRNSPNAPQDITDIKKRVAELMRKKGEELTGVDLLERMDLKDTSH